MTIDLNIKKKNMSKELTEEISKDFYLRVLKFTQKSNHSPIEAYKI